ncbi:MAG: hypothetical protein WEB52_12685 [Dehalococcoidia bacterium]
MRRFDFATAFWFRVPLKVLVLCVTVFAFLSLVPALMDGDADDVQRAIFGFTVVAMFAAIASTFAVAINDSFVEIEGEVVYVRFEAFFNMEFPLNDVVSARLIDPRPRWRYRFGLSTNFADRISCSHGGRLIEVTLARPWRTRLWPRYIDVTRVWLAVTDPDALLSTLRGRSAQSPGALYRAQRAA